MNKIAEVFVGQQLPEIEYTPDNVQLFLYNAVLWNAHRIHFDLPYATEEEGYPGLVIAGPLMGDWLTQCVLEWVDDEGHITFVEYSNRKAAYIGETLRSGGEVTAYDKDLREVTVNVFIKNEADEIIVPGTVKVRLN
jgi:hydroxyacyl-ACP dehydratase HTD2-like protein with hotdog domain